MPIEEFDVRVHGGLFAAVEYFDKAQELTHLVQELFPDLELDVRFGVMEGAPDPVLTLEEPPIWSIWVFPKERPKYEQAYWELGSKLGNLARLMAWPLATYPIKAIPCEGDTNGPREV